MADWIDHDGDTMPVKAETIVCIRVRDGEETPAHWMTPASDWNWRWADPRSGDAFRSGDIMAYRIVEASKEKVETAS